MQKYLRLLNLRLDVVVNDITGLAIIDTICKGEKNPEILAALRNGNCRKSATEIAKALHSNGRTDYLFALHQEYDIYKSLQQKIQQCGASIEELIKSFINADENKKKLKTDAKPHKRVNKNAPQNFDLNQIAYQYFNGIDLMAVEGVGHSTIIALMSEVRVDGLKKFDTAKWFARWLRLSPNNRVSGGRVLSHKIPKGSNRLKIALRNAANAISNLKDTHLSNFFKRIAFRRGRAAAISATARKLAIIIRDMVVKAIPYSPPAQYEFLDQKRKRKVLEMKRLIHKFNITTHDLGLQL